MTESPASALLSPATLAKAIGVSESSIKRWVDDGSLGAVRTAGGHRRIAADVAIRFIHQRGLNVLLPELLAVPGADGTAAAVAKALESGDARGLAAVMLARHLEGFPVARQCDEWLQPALERIGTLWLHGDEGILVEHRATEACSMALLSLRQRLGENVGESAPLAIGGSGPGDPYQIPSQMVSLVFAVEGWRTVNLGADTPLAALELSLDRHAPRALWCSFSSPAESRLAPRLLTLAEKAAKAGAVVLVGGRGLGDLALPDHPGLVRAGSMRDLGLLARALAAVTRTPIGLPR